MGGELLVVALELGPMLAQFRQARLQSVRARCSRRRSCVAAPCGPQRCGQLLTQQQAVALRRCMRSADVRQPLLQCICARSHSFSQYVCIVHRAWCTHIISKKAWEWSTSAASWRGRACFNVLGLMLHGIYDRCHDDLSLRQAANMARNELVSPAHCSQACHIGYSMARRLG